MLICVDVTLFAVCLVSVTEVLKSTICYLLKVVAWCLVAIKASQFIIWPEWILSQVSGLVSVSK